MRLNGMLRCLVGAAVLAMPGLVRAQTTEALQARIAELEASQAQMRAQMADLQGGDWLNERRAEEVKALVRDVLNDAETRTSLLGDEGMQIEFGVHIQVRYLADWRDDPIAAEGDSAGNLDDYEGGFQVRRAKFQVEGTTDAGFGFWLSMAANRDSTDVEMEDAWISYAFERVDLVVGRFKQPFHLEEITSSKRQLAVDRSYVHEEFFNVGRGEGLQLQYATDMFRLHGALTDGSMSGEPGGTGNDFQEDMSDIAAMARGELLLAGDWSDYKDFAAWPGQDTLIVVGGGVFWQEGETGEDTVNGDTFAWTVDGSVEMGALNLQAIFNGMHSDPDDPAADDQDLYGLVVQAGYTIPFGDNYLQPFGRWEHFFDDAMDVDGDGRDDGDMDILTAGANLYFDKHDAKLTVDVVWFFDPVLSAQDGLGILGDAEDNSVALRTQFQLVF